MNPYLERFWRSVHAPMIIYGRDMLNECLPEGLLAVAEERMYVEILKKPTIALSIPTSE